MQIQVFHQKSKIGFLRKTVKSHHQNRKIRFSAKKTKLDFPPKLQN